MQSQLNESHIEEKAYSAEGGEQSEINSYVHETAIADVCNSNTIAAVSDRSEHELICIMNTMKLCYRSQ